MWYIIIIFVVVFDIAMFLILPQIFGNQFTVTELDLTAQSINTTSDLISAGINPFSFFGNILTFQVQGSEIFAIIFYFSLLLLGLCLIKLIRGS